MTPRRRATSWRKRSTWPSRDVPARFISTCRRTSLTKACRYDNYRDIRLDVRPVLPDPAAVAAAAKVIARGAAAQEVRHRPHRLRRDPQRRWRRAARTASSVSRSRSRPRSTARGSSARITRWRSGFSPTAATAPPARLSSRADVVLAVGNSFAQHATFNFRPDLFDGKTLIHINISAQEIGKVYKADHALVSDAKPAIARLTEELSRLVHPRRSGEGAKRTVTRRTRSSTSTAATSIPANSRSRCRSCCPKTPSCSPMPARIWLGSAITCNCRKGSTTASPAASARWPGP